MVRWLVSHIKNVLDSDGTENVSCSRKCHFQVVFYGFFLFLHSEINSSCHPIGRIEMRSFSDGDDNVATSGS